ncbi:MAG: OB-fold nucleic acid binding domain-containing protein [Candidatus Bathyarchaeia archaeon]
MRSKSRDIEVIGTIVKMEPIQLASKKLVKATLEDETGSIILNLWGTQVDQCRLGDVVRVRKAYVKVHNGIPELNTWEDIEVLERAES